MLASKYHISYFEYGLPQFITTDDRTKAYETARVIARNLKQQTGKYTVFIHQHIKGKPPIRIDTLSNKYN